MVYTTTLLQYYTSIFLIFFVCKQVHASGNYKKFVAPGMNPDAFPQPDFDELAPFCASQDPCGYYSFRNPYVHPYRWIQSWCRCGPNQECVYTRTDMKMRLYRHHCLHRDLLPPDIEYATNIKYDSF